MEVEINSKGPNQVLFHTLPITYVCIQPMLCNSRCVNTVSGNPRVHGLLCPMDTLISVCGGVRERGEGGEGGRGRGGRGGITLWLPCMLLYYFRCDQEGFGRYQHIGYLG